MCSCRYGRAQLDEGCGDDPENWCIGVGDMADYCRETLKGHDISYEEAMRILENAEKMASFIKLPILMAKAKFLLFVTVILIFVML